ncbi:disrupted in schizophrenia 1 protein isoform X5 [Callithrix jacchus]|uniref:disrupted in schizophrenia 1 protein isoform X6 n=1 Tax=Callithrix jacchus TaxID=9483 RepID=UPI0023DD18EB|nr:disrupted in schizophrenia 1 protein isoform X6 [Callithrix jacchus]
MPGGRPQGAPAACGGGVGHCAGSRDCLPPAACFRRRRLARRPGYMRSSTGPGIGFLSPAVGTLFHVPGGVSGEESHHSESRARQCGLDPKGLLVGSPVSESIAAPAVTSVRGTSAHFGIQLRDGTRLPDRLSWPCVGWQQEFSAMDSSETLDDSWEAACSERTSSTQAAGSLPSAELSSCSPGCAPEAPSAPPGSQSAFASSFSFIRLSLGSAGERGEAEGCPPSRETESPFQSTRDMGAKTASLNEPHEDPRCLPQPFSLLAPRVLADSAQATGNSSRPEREMHSLRDMDLGSSSSLDPSLAGCGGDGSSDLGDAHSWDALLRKWEPVLQDCLLRNRRQVEVISLRLKLQKLQEDAVEDDDYDKGPVEMAPKPHSEWSPGCWNPLLRTTCTCPSRDEIGFFRKSSNYSLQERIKSLNLSLQEITTKVCMSEKFCSTLRRKVNDIETQLPALLEAKMHAISGNHFCTAKDLTEEIRSLTSEREGLEGLLSKLLVLSSRNVKKLGSVKEDYDRLRRELEHQEAAYEKSVKENTVKYMKTLEDKLCSCKCPLLGKVWEADLEACRLLIQRLQLHEAKGSLSVEDEGQMDDLVGAVCSAAPPIPPRLHSEDERKTPLQALEEWKGHLNPSLHWAGGEQKEESYILSAELGEKCEDIGKKLLYLEDQLHTAIHSHDEDLIQSLKRELQMVKETLQAMILQLQPAKEAGEREAAASCMTAGVREVQA